MTALANVIFPAFATPYVSALLFPVAAIAALMAEIIVFRILNRDVSWLVSTVVAINIASSAVGFLIAAVLPSGLVPTVVGEGENHREIIQLGPKFGMYAVLGYVLAFILSILIEWGIVRGLRRVTNIARPFRTVVFANVASYATLIVVSVVWLRFLW